MKKRLKRNFSFTFEALLFVSLLYDGCFIGSHSFHLTICSKVNINQSRDFSLLASYLSQLTGRRERNILVFIT